MRADDGHEHVVHEDVTTAPNAPPMITAKNARYITFPQHGSLEILPQVYLLLMMR